jgi:hypothetical protein
MQAYEFNIQTSEKGELLIPSEIQKILQAQKKARVILLVDDDGTEWKHFTNMAFKAGYSEKDADYDDVPAAEIAKLAEAGGAFDFLADPDEDIYSDEDLKVRYR